MWRLDLPAQWASACAAALGGVGAYVSLASDAAMQLFGVPLPVLLASLTGACGARVFLPPSPFWRAASSSFFWTFFGVFVPNLVLWIASQWVAAAPPAGAVAGVALVTAALGQRVVPILWEKGGAALERKLDGLWARHNDGDKGGTP
jgi:hypothetical protein